MIVKKFLNDFVLWKKKQKISNFGSYNLPEDVENREFLEDWIKKRNKIEKFSGNVLQVIMSTNWIEDMDFIVNSAEVHQFPYVIVGKKKKNFKKKTKKTKKPNKKLFIFILQIL